VPDNRPVVVLNVAHAGGFTMLNVNALPFASAAVGVNEYALPATTDVAGVPEMVGAMLPLLTLIENAGNDVVAVPSLTRMVMLE
jgi:hypothetical protein